MYGKCRCPNSSSSSPLSNFSLYARISLTIAIFRRSYLSSISMVTLCRVSNAWLVSVTIGSSEPGKTARKWFWILRRSEERRVGKEGKDMKEEAGSEKNESEMYSVDVMNC